MSERHEGDEEEVRGPGRIERLYETIAKLEIENRSLQRQVRERQLERERERAQLEAVREFLRPLTDALGLVDQEDVW